VVFCSTCNSPDHPMPWIFILARGASSHSIMFTALLLKLESCGRFRVFQPDQVRFKQAFLAPLGDANAGEPHGLHGGRLTYYDEQTTARVYPASKYFRNG